MPSSASASLFLCLPPRLWPFSYAFLRGPSLMPSSASASLALTTLRLLHMFTLRYVKFMLPNPSACQVGMLSQNDT